MSAHRRLRGPLLNGAGRLFTPLELLAGFVAAMVHDYNHPVRRTATTRRLETEAPSCCVQGRTNAFLIASRNDLAILYNDRCALGCGRLG